jgi:hypothetical protein
MLGHARPHVGLMVLHATQGHFHLRRDPGRGEVRVEVASNAAGLLVVEPLEILTGLPKRRSGGLGVEVAKMLADHDLLAQRKGDRALELPPNSERGG